MIRFNETFPWSPIYCRQAHCKHEILLSAKLLQGLSRMRKQNSNPDKNIPVAADMSNGLYERQGFVKFRVFWDILPCSQTDVDRRFRGACCLHHQGDEWA
jgi:hypothetical protein